MTTKQIDKFLIAADISIKEAMRRMGRAASKVLFVVDKQSKLLGSLTDGDIRRWVLNKGSLNAKVNKIYFKHAVSVPEKFNSNEVKQIMIAKRIEGMPVINNNGQVCDVLLWVDLFGAEQKTYLKKLSLPVVIMAGGKGTRLDPFTKVLPKPLIPINDKTIIEIIIEKFKEQGADRFYVSLSHKARMIKAFFEELKPSYKVQYIEEDKPLGTAGSLRFLDKVNGSSIIVSNCDIVVDTDYSQIIEHHKEKGNDLTLVGSFRHFTIPYGICKIENGGGLKSIFEKPEYDYLVNTGMYIINKNILKLIPKNKYFDITDLIKAAKQKRKKIGVYPIDEKSWIDVGQWEEYRRALKLFGLNE